MTFATSPDQEMQATSGIRVAVFDDSREQRDGLDAMLSSVEDMECVGAFASAVRVVHEVERCAPHVVLMDIDMPGVDGIAAVAQLRSRFAELPIIMLTVIEDDDRIFAAIMAGADGYFLKQISPAELVVGIREALDGGAPMSPSVARRVLHLMKVGLPRTKSNEFALTDREQQILTMLVQGHTYKRIASELGISYGTVNKHVSHVYTKLRVHIVNEAVALAIRKGLA